MAAGDPDHFFFVLRDLHLLRSYERSESPFLDRNLKQPSPSFYGENEFRFNEPLHGLKWLQAMDHSNIAALKTMSFFIDPIYEDALAPAKKRSSELWHAILKILARHAQSLQSLDIYWDADIPGRFGGGVDKVFVRALGKLRSLKVLKLDGYYAKEWPTYLQESLGADALIVSPRAGDKGYRKGLRGYQRRLKPLDPRTLD
ncbi:Uu.00g040390.m01.CDS01 [Anthostomella pinea]|uniref:Uu.00g040390.m01.CDS01 n=1 Tax=Anthostomella pinea TaxID=933095 RepID=A0AAI8VA76_9PEZI|nr:Uu.00g040390.m01.CDS01 [Anthostomella pinea]